VNGTSLSLIANDTTNSTSFWAALVPTGNGTNGGSNVVLTIIGTSFTYRSVYMWAAYNLTSTTVINTASNTGGTLSINVSAGDYLFEVIEAVTTFAGSTEAPAGVHTSGASFDCVADWQIAAPATPFSVVPVASSYQCCANWH
jgi:hypothetical protein